MDIFREILALPPRHPTHRKAHSGQVPKSSVSNPPATSVPESNSTETTSTVPETRDFFIMSKEATQPEQTDTISQPEHKAKSSTLSVITELPMLEKLPPNLEPPYSRQKPLEPEEISAVPEEISRSAVRDS